jgi:DNA modification methylase
MSHPSGQRNALNDLTGSEWAQSSKSVMEYEDTRSQKQKIHGASFPRSLAEHHILMYTRKGEVVLDPFVGVGTTLDACISTGRKGIGIELNSQFVKLARKDLRQNGIRNQSIIQGDARYLLSHLKRDSVDFIITSPPYADMLKKIQGQFLYKWKPYGFKSMSNTKPYSKNPSDIGNMKYEEALDSLELVLKATYEVLKPNSYAVWVVKDFRDLKNKLPYVNFHNDIIDRAKSNNWILWDIRIFDQTRFRPLIVLGIPSRNFYLNMGHSYILIFKKE